MSGSRHSPPLAWSLSRFVSLLFTVFFQSGSVPLIMSQVTSAATDPFGLLCDFLRGAKYGTPLELMDAALRDEELGAALLVEFCAQMRVNRRTRRNMATLTNAHGQSPWPRWYGVSARQVYTMMQLCRKMALPEENVVGPMISACRGMWRLLSHASLAAGRLPPSGQQAHARTNTIRRSMAGKQVVVQFDNWYRRRYRSGPVRPHCRLNVTAMSVLHTTAIAMYPGFPTLDDLLQRIPQAAQTIAGSFRDFPRAADALRRDPPEAQYVRVPLDVHQDNIRSLQWYPLTLADLVFSSNEDLLHIME